MFLLNLEIGVKTPLFGFILFVMRGVIPVAVLLIMLFPDVALGLPNMMIGQ